MNIRRFTPEQVREKQRANWRRQAARKRLQTRLCPTERRLSDHRSPLYAIEILSRDDVAELFQLTPETIRNVERAALAKIRKAIEPYYREEMA